MRPEVILWLYIIFLVVGGMIGFFKAKSAISLMMSVIFAALLIPCALGIIFKPYMADVFLGVLLVVFGIRLAKTKKFMPAGMMLVVTIAVLALRHF